MFRGSTLREQGIFLSLEKIHGGHDESVDPILRRALTTHPDTFCVFFLYNPTRVLEEQRPLSSPPPPVRSPALHTSPSLHNSLRPSLRPSPERQLGARPLSHPPFPPSAVLMRSDSRHLRRRASVRDPPDHTPVIPPVSTPRPRRPPPPTPRSSFPSKLRKIALPV